MDLNEIKFEDVTVVDNGTAVFRINLAINPRLNNDAYLGQVSDTILSKYPRCRFIEFHRDEVHLFIVCRGDLNPVAFTNGAQQ